MAGRPTKNTSESDSINKDLKNENKDLKQQLFQMQEMLKALSDQINKPKEKTEPIVEFTDEDEYIEIPLNKPIKVISLFNGGLNLKTSRDDTAPIRFTGVGQIQPIIYNDLIKMISQQRKFFEEGYCKILDKQVVKTHYLENFYEKILDANDIINILDFDKDKIQETFETALPINQRAIVDLLIKKINNNDPVDKNKVEIITRIYGSDIFDLAHKMR
jgi:hypothetical protein